MVLIKTLVPVLMILFASSVLCDDIPVNRQNTSRPIRQRYKFNHPPAAESYEPIPVVIVYGGEGTRGDKSIDAKSSIDIQKVSPKELQSLNISNSAVNDAKDDIEVKIFKNTTKNEERLLKSRPFSVSELQIPVAVIYDEPVTPGVRNNKRNHPTSDKTSGRRRRPQRPSQQSTTETEISKKNLEKEKNENAATTESQNKVVNSKISTPTDTKNIFDNDNKKKSPKDIQITTYRPTQTSEVQKEKNKGITSKPDDTRIAKKKRERDPVVPIIESENRVYSHTGEFVYSYEGGDGTKAFEKGELKSFDEDKTGEAVVGGFSYKDKDGNDISLTYTADENGYRPVGAHLPTPPPIPPAIARALAYLATKSTPQPEPVTEKVTKSE